MSHPSHTPDTAASHTPETSTSRTSRTKHLFLEPLEAIGFWAAVGLPFIYVPLVLRGLETTGLQLTVAVLIAMHVLALVAGRQYKTD